MSKYVYNKPNFSDELHNMDILDFPIFHTTKGILRVTTNIIPQSMLYNITFDLVQRKP